MADQGNIIIRGARVNNLRNVSLELPRGKFIVVTGVSGSGKSSLAFDTLFAEGQRRFAESLSSYSRQFLGRMVKPDVDLIDGIPPAIAIEQKVTTRNPRSTVATTTEIYDFLRLIYARIGHTFSPVSGREVHADTAQDAVKWLLQQDFGTEAIHILADLGWTGRQDHTELLLSLKEQGYSRLWADGQPLKIEDVLQMAAEPTEVYLLVDRFRDFSDRDRLLSSVSDAFGRGDSRIHIATIEGGIIKSFSTHFELDGMTFRLPDEYLFSFNSPLGACPVCGGLGKIIGISEDLVVPDKTQSIYDGCIACWRGDKMGWFKDRLVACAEKYGIDIFTPWCKLPRSQKDIIWHSRSVDGDETTIIGLDEFFEWVGTQRYKIQFKYMLSRFSGKADCGECHGTRLRHEALYVKVGGKTIAELLDMTSEQLLAFLDALELDETELAVVAEPLSEVRSRLKCICDVGLSYLTLSRTCNTHSGPN